ncbi:MAG: CAP-associated domain-containing protein, partial [Staphylococcus sp.]|nr:CAP-associated domain-containing protein [Staphylococcus sp.]
MTKLVIKVLGVVFLITFLIYLFYSPRLKFDVLENPNNNNKISHSNQVSHSVKKQTENPAPKNGIGTWIGKDINYLTNKYGQANRTYPVKGGYTDYIVKRKQQYYIVTTKHDEIKSVYATGEKAQTGSLKINENASHIFEKTSINPDPSFKVNGKQYNFELSDEDIKTQTLIKYGNIYAQVYVDQQSNRIMGIRYLDKELLAFIKPYQLTDEEDISDDKFNNDRNNKDSLPYEQSPNQLITLYEITNQMRDLKHIPPLKVNSDIS